MAAHYYVFLEKYISQQQVKIVLRKHSSSTEMRLKSDIKSNEFLEAANESIEKFNFSRAFVSINQALCFATTNNQLAKLYATRALYYFKVKKIKEYLCNIQLAKNYGYKEELIKIENHSEKLSGEENIHDIFKLSLPTNEKIPYAANCLRLFESWKFGRGVKTERKLKTGDVVLIEEPFFKMLSKEARFQRCANCFKSNFMNIFPCLRNCTITMFCSEACENSAWKRFHQYECAILDEAVENSEYDLMILKITFETLSLCDGSVDKMKNLLASVKSVQSAYDYDFSGSEKECDKNRLKTIYALKKGSNSDEDLATANFLLDNNIKLKSFYKTKIQRDFLKEFMLNMMGIVDRNNYIINSLCTFDSSSEYEVGSGLFPFASLINHSCSPNLCRVLVDNKQIYIARKPILAGEQLFVAYTSNFSQCDRNTRQMLLFKDFQFKCMCEACVNNFPLMHQLKKYDKDFVSPSIEFKLSEAKRVYRENCDFIDKHIQKFPFPNYEVCSLMQCSLLLLHYLASLVTNFQ